MDGSAVNHVNKRWLAGVDHHRAYELAKEAVSRALALDPDDAIAHSVRGTIAMGYDCDFRSAALHYQRALELTPSSYDVLWEAGWFAGMMGRTSDAIAVLQHLIRVEPLNPMAGGGLAWFHLTAGEPKTAIETARATMRLNPDFADIRCALGWGLLLTGNPDEARATIELEANPNVLLRSLSAVHHELGNDVEAQALVEQLISSTSRGTQPGDHHAGYFFAFQIRVLAHLLAFAQVGDRAAYPGTKPRPPESSGRSSASGVIRRS